MRRKYTITIGFPSGAVQTDIFHSKKKANAYAKAIGSAYAHQALNVSLTVECGGAKQSETFVKPARSAS